MNPLLPVLLAAGAAATAVGLPRRDRLAVILAAPGGDVAPRRELDDATRTAARPLRLLAGRSRRWAPPAAGVALLLLRGPVAGVLAVVGVALLLRSNKTRSARRLRAAERAGAAEACAALSSELRAGRTPADALGLAAVCGSGAVAAGLGEAAAAARLGAEVPTVLLAAAADSAAPELLRGLAACWQVCSATGSGLAAAVDRLGEGLRSEERQRQDVEAELAGPRATAGLLAALPLAGIGLAAALGARPVHVLLDTPVGIGALLAGTGLDLLGVWWTGCIVRGAGGSP